MCRETTFKTWETLRERVTRKLSVFPQESERFSYNPDQTPEEGLYFFFVSVYLSLCLSVYVCECVCVCARRTLLKYQKKKVKKVKICEGKKFNASALMEVKLLFLICEKVPK